MHAAKRLRALLLTRCCLLATAFRRGLLLAAFFLLRARSRFAACILFGLCRGGGTCALFGKQALLFGALRIELGFRGCAFGCCSRLLGCNFIGRRTRGTGGQQQGQ